MKYILKLSIGFLLVILILGFLSGGIDRVYKEFFGKWDKQIENEIYEESIQYIKGTNEELAKNKREYDRYMIEGDDHAASIVIVNMQNILMDYDTDKITNKLLREFCEEINAGVYE